MWDSATGKPQGYENAQQVSVKEVYVEDIYQLSALLTKLEKQRNSCIVRGRFIGHEAARDLYPAEIEADARRGKALKPPKDGFTLRRLRFFNDQPLHYFFLDIDRFVPVGVDPVTQPQAAIEQYIAKHLPPCFQGATYHWQLSSGAGHPDNAGVLKAHVAFWLLTPTLGEHLRAWALGSGIAMDTSVFGAVQPNYTAAPVFVEGVADPVPQRSGLSEGWAGDDVDLVIESAILERARAVHKSRREMVDPREKDGLIGLFHRTFEIEEVVERWLGDVFEFVDDWRLNFLRSASGAAEGAGVTDNRQGLFNTHSSDPLGNRATNKWDLVRHYLFGHLDEGIDRDERALLGPGGWPSQQAMTEMVQALPEIQAAQGAAEAQERAERDATMQGLLADIAAVSAAGDLESAVAPKVAKLKSLLDTEREQLAQAMQGKAKELGLPLAISVVRGWLRYRTGGAVAGGGDGGPEWARDWVYLTGGDKFFNLRSKAEVTVTGFRAMFNRLMPMDRDGNREKADQAALEVWGMPVVDHKAYMPGVGDVFEMFGRRWVNLYRPESAPAVPGDGDLTEADREAVRVVEQHFAVMFDDERERRLLLSWIAHNVQKVGVKIRWAPYIHGVPGDGKSFFADLLASAMGGQNVTPLNAKVLESSFNEWAIGAAVVAIEEMMQHGHSRYDVMNGVKPLITNDTVNIHPKGKAAYSAPNVTNYIVFSNFLDGAPVDATDRRYMFLSSSVTVDGAKKMTATGYFKTLFDAVRQHSGAMRKWLMGVSLDREFDANGRAPDTRIKATVIEMSKSDLENAIEDVLEGGAEGVTKDVLSSSHFTAAIKARGVEPPATKAVKRTLGNLGFEFLGRERWAGDMRNIWVKRGLNLRKDQALAVLSRSGVESDFLSSQNDH